MKKQYMPPVAKRPYAAPSQQTVCVGSAVLQAASPERRLGVEGDLDDEESLL